MFFYWLRYTFRIDVSGNAIMEKFFRELEKLIIAQKHELRYNYRSCFIHVEAPSLLYIETAILCVVSELIIIIKNHTSS